MFKLIRPLLGAIIAVASIGSNIRSIAANAYPGQIQQPARNLQAQFMSPHTLNGSSSFGDPWRQIDRPAGFGSFDDRPRSLYPINSPDTSTQCPAGSARESRCNSSTTANDGKSPKATPAAASGLKNGLPVARQNSNSNNTPYRVRWNNSNKFKK